MVTNFSDSSCCRPCCAGTAREHAVHDGRHPTRCCARSERLSRSPQTSRLGVAGGGWASRVRWGTRELPVVAGAPVVRDHQDDVRTALRRARVYWMPCRGSARCRQAPRHRLRAVWRSRNLAGHVEGAVVMPGAHRRGRRPSPDQCMREAAKTDKETNTTLSTIPSVVRPPMATSQAFFALHQFHAPHCGDYTCEPPDAPDVVVPRSHVCIALNRYG
jgi:hypothetical protein